MSTVWLLDTYGDPVGAVREFLTHLWPVARLEGLLAPVVQPPGMVTRLLENPEQLAEVNAFAPLVPANAGVAAARLASERPQARYGALLRSCEARAWKKLAADADIDQGRWLIIGMDCLASYPQEDFEWRLRRAGGVEALSREALRFARQGGIAPYRFRQGCQMCTSPDSEKVDLHFGLYGLPVKERILIIAKDNETAARLRLEDLTSGPAPEALVGQNQKMLITVSRRKMGVRQRAIAALAADLPAGPVSLARHLAGCAPCQACLEACPTYTGEWVESGNTLAWRSWLISCLSCGLCEQACPKHLPLTALHAKIRQDLSIRRSIDAATHSN
jgi:formate dehydrogenase subunit beta